MTNEELKRSIINEVRPFCVHSHEEGALLSIAEEEMYERVMNLIDQWVAEAIGEDDPLWSSIQMISRNQLRDEQRKRAGIDKKEK